MNEALERLWEPVGVLLRDATVSEVLINGPSEVWVERHGCLERASEAFSSSATLEAALLAAAQWAGRPFDDQRPILETQLPDGSRLEAVLPPLCAQGPIVAIRRFSKAKMDLGGLVERKTLSLAAASYLVQALEQRKNVVVCGGTGSGKTSLLSALAACLPRAERIVTIEDTRELCLDLPHVVALEARPADDRGQGQVGIRELLRATLRLRPDRIVVGEVRGAEALDLVQAMNTGHGGSLTTVHASSCVGALRRLETMALMGDVGIPLHALRAQVAAAVQLVAHIERQSDGSRHVLSISRLKPMEGASDYRLVEVFCRARDGRLCCRPHRPSGGST
ncbi:MAG: Flp pilus assembly complex ATPase component TadA [Myxococcota bacterium]|nr:Flp pilus assembly complex ATPase component TadA [Myxococcota bacterium]